jgi:hypothetical protein
MISKCMQNFDSPLVFPNVKFHEMFSPNLSLLKLSPMHILSQELATWRCNILRHVVWVWPVFSSFSSTEKGNAKSK